MLTHWLKFELDKFNPDLSKNTVNRKRIRKEDVMKKRISMMVAAVTLTLVPVAGVNAADFYPLVSPDTNAKPEAAAHAREDGTAKNYTDFYPIVSPDTNAKPEVKADAPEKPWTKDVADFFPVVSPRF